MPLRKVRVSYHVEALYAAQGLGWCAVCGAAGSRAYCDGWVNAMDSLYPSRPHRIVKTTADGSLYEVVKETPGRAAPHLNN